MCCKHTKNNKQKKFLINFKCHFSVCARVWPLHFMLKRERDNRCGMTMVVMMTVWRFHCHKLCCTSNHTTKMPFYLCCVLMIHVYANWPNIYNNSHIILANGNGNSSIIIFFRCLIKVFIAVEAFVLFWWREKKTFLFWILDRSFVEIICGEKCPQSFNNHLVDVWLLVVFFYCNWLLFEQWNSDGISCTSVKHSR